MCVCQHVCGIRLEQSEHVLARGEKSLNQLVATKALSPLSSSRRLPLSLFPHSLPQNPLRSFSNAYYKQDILLNPESLPLLPGFFVRAPLWIRITEPALKENSTSSA